MPSKHITTVDLYMDKLETKEVQNQQVKERSSLRTLREIRADKI